MVNAVSPYNVMVCDAMFGKCRS